MLKTLGVHFIRHPCLTRKLQVRPPAPKKAGLCLFVVAEVWRGLSKCGRWGRRVLAPTLCDRYHASLRLRSLGSAHPCTTRTVRVLPPAPKKAGLCLFRHSPAFFGADGGGRTRTVLLPTDFESVTSANSITSAY